MKIQIKQARELYSALVSITSGTHAAVTKLANGDQTSTQVPYELDDKARWNLTKNLSLAEKIVKDADKAREGILRELTGGAGKDLKKSEDPEKFAQWLARVEALEEQVESAPFLRVKLTGLKVSNTNPVPGIVVAALRPILEEDVPAPDASEVIPD